MKGDEVGAGLGEIEGQAIDRRDHEMDVDRDRDMRSDRGTDHRADGQIGHVMVVHYVEMDEICTGVLHRTDLFAESGKVGRQNTGRNSEGSRHDFRITH